MNLIARYTALIVMSLALPVITIVPTFDPDDTGIALLARLMIVPIYGCLAVFLMTSFRPANMRRYLQQTPTRIDDFHLWLAPAMVMLSFIWAGFVLIGMLALADFHNSHPFLFLGVFLGTGGLAIWIAIRVRRAFFQG